jgi:hypothetical protein
MKGMVNKNKYKEVQEEIQEVSRALKESTNNLVRSLKENPNISGNLIKVKRDRTELNDVLLRCIQEFRDYGKYSAITLKVDEENHNRIKFQQLKTRERGLRDAVVKLEEAKQEEEKSFQFTTTAQKLAILQLKEKLLSVKGSTSTDAKFRRKESMASVSAIWREHKHKEHQLEMRQKALEDKLHTETIVNSETRQFLGKKQQLLSDSLQHWESKYDQEIGDLDSEIARITARRNSLLENLGTLQARKDADDKVEADLAAADLLKIQTKAAQKALVKAQNRAARRIQRELRSFVKRKKELEAIQGAGKKKKGGDKKGKKGKK